VPETKTGIYTVDFSYDSKLLGIAGAGKMTIYEPIFIKTSSEQNNKIVSLCAIISKLSNRSIFIVDNGLSRVFSPSIFSSMVVNDLVHRN